MLTPRIESVIAEKQGKVLLAKVDIDENSDLALDYEVYYLFILLFYVFVQNKRLLSSYIGRIRSSVNCNEGWKGFRENCWPSG